MEIKVHAHFEPLLHATERYLVMCGGRGSGKSEFAARKILYRALKEGHHRFLIMRKVRKSLEGSVIRVMRTLLAEQGIAHEYNKTDRIIRFVGPTGSNELLFDGLDDPEKIKSIKGITSIWLEEATEFTKDDFFTIDLSLREPGPAYHQIMLTFNPLEAEAPWLKEMFFDPVAPHPKARVHKSTIEHNPIAEVRAQYMPILDALKIQDPTLYEMWRLGDWAMPKGQIYHWPVGPLPGGKFDEVFYGGDFGYTVNPSAVVRIYRRGDDDFWVEDVVYKPGLTNQALAFEMKGEGIGPYDPVYFDAAEPKSIDEIVGQGFNVHPAQKGPDSVRAGIAFLQAKRITIVAGSTNIIKEASSYKWREDKNGNPLPEPVKFNDHALDAIRYGIFTHMKRAGVFFGVTKQDVY